MDSISRGCNGAGWKLCPGKGFKQESHAVGGVQRPEGGQTVGGKASAVLRIPTALEPPRAAKRAGSHAVPAKRTEASSGDSGLTAVGGAG